MDEYIGREISPTILKYPSIVMGVLVSDYGALRLWSLSSQGMSISSRMGDGEVVLQPTISRLISSSCLDIDLIDGISLQTID